MYVQYVPPPPPPAADEAATERTRMEEKRPDNNTIVLAPQSVNVRPEELEGLAKALRRYMPDRMVTIVARPASRPVASPWDILNILVPWLDLEQDAVAAAVGIIAREMIRWARQRLKASPGRPKYVAILGPGGEVLKSVRVQKDKVVDMTAEDRRRRALKSARAPQDKVAGMTAKNSERKKRKSIRAQKGKVAGIAAEDRQTEDSQPDPLAAQVDESIRKLSKLRDDRTITDAEFETMKARVLSRLRGSAQLVCVTLRQAAGARGHLPGERTGGMAILAFGLGLGATTSVTNSGAFAGGWTAIIGLGSGVVGATAASASLGVLSAERAGVGSAR
jgi:hypothetical protein